MEMLHLSLLGGYQVMVNGELVTRFRNTKTVGLLAYLTIEADRPHTRSALCGLFWPKFTENSARTNLRQTLHQLRKIINDQESSPPYLLITHASIQVNPQSECWRDAAEFIHLVKAEKNDALEEAIRLYRGEFLAGYELPDCPEFEQWLFARRRYFHDLALDTMHRLADEFLNTGDYAKAQQFGRKQLDLNRAQESAHRQLMLALAHSGRRTEALQQYDHCQQILHEDLDVEPDEETRAIYAQIKAGNFEGERILQRHDHLPLADPKLPLLTEQVPNNIRAQLAPLIGREQELQTIGQQLLHAGVRLLTLVGMGGVGKTRLAQTVARSLADATDSPFADGLWFVSLTEVGREAENATIALVVAMAETLELSLDFDSDPERRLLAYLSPKQLLLILDNFEHLMEAAPLLLNILQAAPNIKILITSREPLKVTQQTVFRLTGLTVPETENVAESYQFGSVRLFLAQAARDNQMFVPDDGEMKAIIQLCQLAGGAPLPILLAASWAKDFTCREILTAVQKNLDFLANNALDLADQHRSVRAVFAHSWTLLSPYEQQILASLTVFRGTFSREAAIAITDANISDLVALTNKSLLEQPSRGVYHMHELLRQFATEKLGPDSEQHYYHRHARYYLDFLHTCGEMLFTPEISEAIQNFKLALDNIRQAWAWTINQIETKPRLVSELPLLESSWALTRFYDLIGYHREGEEQLRLAVTAISSIHVRPGDEMWQQQVPCHLQAQWSHFLARLGRYQHAIELSQEVISLAKTLSDSYSAVVGHLVYGRCLVSLGSYDTAREIYENQLAVAHGVRAYPEEVFMLIELGVINIHLSDYQKAQPYLEKALQLAHQVKDYRGQASAFGHLGRIALDKSEYDIAEDNFHQVLKIAELIGPHIKIVPLAAIGWIAHKQGNLAKAKSCFKESLDLARKMGHPPDISRGLRGLAWVAYQNADYSAANKHFEESLQTIRHAGHQHGEAITLNNWGFMNDLQGDHALARQRFNASLDISRRLSARLLIANTSVNLAFNLLATHEITRAKYCLYEALSIAHEIGAKTVVNEAIAGYARLFLMLGDAEQSDNLVTVVWNHPYTPFELVETRLQFLKRELTVILGKAQIEAKLDQKSGLALESIVNQLLNQETSSVDQI